ncbi:MAG TPA: DUF4845 domain-containing protein [Gammaproteobacteria bacterium]|nr:DUF4845 domain-containing protein [Gammaproteobacteria bacterium]
MGGAAVRGERGVGLVSILFWLVLAAFVVWLGARVVPLYFEYWTIHTVFQEQVRKGNLYDTPQEMKRQVLKELEFQDVSRLKADDVKVEALPGDGHYRVSADYEAEVHLTDRVRLVYHFQPEAREGG